MAGVRALSRTIFIAIAVCACLLRAAAAATVTVDELTYDATGRCVPKTSDVCNGVAGIAMGGMIYVNDARNESSIAASASSYMTQLGPLASVAPECYSATILFLCLAAFNPCETRQVNASLSVATASPPCQAVCDNGLTLCADIFKQFNRSYPACPDTVVYDFTQSGAAANFTPNCSSGVAVVAECRPIYEIYIKPPVADRWYTALRVLGWIGLVMNVVLIGLYIVNTRLPEWPGPLILLMAVSQGIFALGVCMCSFSGRRELMCDHSKVCKAQAAFIYIGALFTMTIWLLLIAVTLALVLSRNPKRMQSSLQRRWYWSLLALLVPTLFCGLAFRDLGPKSFAMLCTSNDGDHLEQFVIWPVAGLLAVGTVAWIATVAVVLKNLSASLNWRRDIRLYLRLLIYELIAFLPAILLVVPFESIRNRVKDGDSSVLRDGSARRVVESINTGAILSPIFFATLFLAQPAHYEFLAEKVGLSTTTRSGSSHHEEKEETSKF